MNRLICLYARNHNIIKRFDMSDFVHLHVHTQFSILDGASDIGALMRQTKEYGMNSLAITDHGNMYGVLHFLKEAKKTGIKPIIGCEAYVAHNSRKDKTAKEDRRGYHLILLAKNIEGYRNLSRMISYANIDGYYFVPRIDKELLRKYHSGLIASSACLGGEIAHNLLHHSTEAAESSLMDYLEIFGDDFYLEMMQHGLPEQTEVNNALIKMASKHNVKLVATNDLHFVNREDARAHDILVCLNTNKDIEDTERMRYTGEEFLKSPDEMAELFSHVPEAIENTIKIAEEIEMISLESKAILPIFPIPEKFKDDNEFLHDLSYQGAAKLYGEITPEISERLDYELKVIRDMGFAGYFLIVQDFINAARRNDVAVGPGRGSAAGSAVAYCTGITSIDPIKYNLLFERFLNPERISMPDIDVDFDDDGREKVISYVIEKYGFDRVAQIVTFGTMAAKSSIRDVARILKLPLSEADYLAKLVPAKPDTTITSAIKDVRELADVKSKWSALAQETLEYAEKLEGSIRQTGVHACGVIIGRDPLVDHIPLSRAKENELMVTQFEGKDVESVGMLKMDFLGLKTLSIIKDAIQNIKRRHNVQIDIDKIPLDDEKTFQLYQRGETMGTFQFESEGMRTHLRDLRPNNIEDLIAMNALYRPGPMDFIPTYIKRKHGKEKVIYPHKMLEELLKPTYGIMVYQEQIMQAAQIMAGYSLGAADILRRAMGKKKPAEMKKQQSIFVDGAIKKGVSKENAEEVFSVMARFAEYGFNRSHSAAYSLVAYQTAYLKANYTAEYMAAVLTRNISDLGKVTEFIEECRRMDIPVLGPDVNESMNRFTVNKAGEIRFGMGAIKGVGEMAVEGIVAERIENDAFQGIFDFAKRVNLRSCNKKCFEALAKAGAFDCFPEISRAQFFHADPDGNAFIDKLIRHANEITNNADSMQQSLFGGLEEIEVVEPQIPQCEGWTHLETLLKEHEVTGFYISGHPLDQYAFELKHLNATPLSAFEDITPMRNKEFSVGGMISSCQHKTTKTGKAFGTFTIEDFTGSSTFSMFSEDYLRYRHLLTPQQFVFVRGKVVPRYNNEDIFEPKVLGIELLSEMIGKAFKGINLYCLIDDLRPEFTKKIQEILKKHKGKSSVAIYLVDEENTKYRFFSTKYHVTLSDTLIKDFLKSGIRDVKPIT
ncbi:MAG: DNA polymerase III subunit alpha [Bacteroidetes bacterium]|nr:DNA polymerase III subunit alpha [Bacteroidota bacterium]